MPRARMTGSTSSEMYVQRQSLECVHHGAGKPVHEAHGVVGEHDPLGVTPIAQARHGVDPLLEGDARQAEVIEAEVRAVLDQAQVVVGVDGAAAVADDDPGEVDTLPP